MQTASAWDAAPSVVHVAEKENENENEVFVFGRFSEEDAQRLEQLRGPNVLGIYRSDEHQFDWPDPAEDEYLSSDTNKGYHETEYDEDGTTRSDQAFDDLCSEEDEVEEAKEDKYEDRDEYDSPASPAPEDLSGRGIALRLMGTANGSGESAFCAARGLVNLGNTCFINAVIQCVVHAPALEGLWLETLAVERRLKEVGLEDVLNCFPLLVELARLAVELRGSSELVANELGSMKGGRDLMMIRPDRFIYASRQFFEMHGAGNQVSIDQASSEFRVVVTAAQQDAHEYLEWLLDMLNEEQLKLLKLDGSSAGAALDMVDQAAFPEEESEEDDDGWQEVGKGGKKTAPQRVGTLDGMHSGRKNFITNTFQGIFRSSVRTAGTKESVTLQPFMCLQLDVLGRHVLSTADAMELLMAPEILTGLKPSGSGADGEGQQGQKMQVFDQLPQVLMLHLKRFVFSQYSERAEKLHKSVKYSHNLVLPESYLSSRLRQELLVGQAGAILDKPAGMVSSRSKVPAFLREYELEAVCLHLGEQAVAGHYISLTRGADPEVWFEQNDYKVRQVAARDVLHLPNAYLLMYVRRGSRPSAQSDDVA
mmetsp:Transcript_14498/g.26924  ORF Transcript_14498/g.26924 Transcript_14498/m.26924 type:complete len:593 (+) Transcript_14498:214-1992(+)